MQNAPERMCIKENSVPVLVLVSSQHGGMGIIRSLGRAGVPVYGVHQYSWEPAARSRYLRDVFCWDFSSAEYADSVSFLLEVAKQVGRQSILLPTSDITARFLAENAKALAEDYLFSAPSAEVVRSFSSKKQTFELCQKLGIPTARTAVPQTRCEVLNFARSTKFPVIVKGEYGDFQQKKTSRSRVAMVATEKDLLEIYDMNTGNSSSQLILQEYIPGADDSIWMFNGYFNDRSECLFGATGQKLRQFPPHRGCTSLGICVRNEMVEKQTTQLMKAVAYRGPLDVGYRFDARDGQYKLLDVNPRIGSTFRLFVAQNQLDVVRALYLDLTGQTVPRTEACEGRKWFVESNDVLSSWTHLRERQLSVGGWVRSVRDVHEGVWLDADDLRPLAALPFLWYRKCFQRKK